MNSACSKRPASWKIRWKNKLHPRTHGHACVNRASSKKLLRKSWILVMTSYPNITRARSEALTCLLRFAKGVETILFHLWFFQTRKTMPKKDRHAGTLNISKWIWKQKFSDDWNGKVWKLSRHTIFWTRATALSAMKTDTAILAAVACWNINCLCLENLIDLHWTICMSSWGIWLALNQERSTSNASRWELACGSQLGRLQRQDSVGENCSHFPISM